MADDARQRNWFTTSDGVKIHYLTLGETGSWVVLIHGYTGSAEGNWFANGIAQALAGRHRVVAIDCRNHGKSDKPEPGRPGRAKEVIELMNLLGIERAHVHGYSMGGLITGRLLNLIPERFITAAFGGSGVLEFDEQLVQSVPADPTETDPEEAIASRKLRIAFALHYGKSQEEAEAAADKPARAPAVDPDAVRQAAAKVDLAKVDFPVLAINGEYDRPLAHTHRLWRELHDFTHVVLPGKSHLTAIMPGYMPQKYTEALVRFIDSNDEETPP